MECCCRHEVPAVTVSSILFSRQLLEYTYVLATLNVFTGRIREALPVLFLTHARADFGVFRPAGVICCTEICQEGVEERTLLPAKFHLDPLRVVGLRFPKRKKNRILTI